VTNLAQRTGVSTERLLGEWALALSVDDYPGLPPGSDVQMPSWNMRNIYAGLNQDLPGTYTLAVPSQPENYAFGAVAPVNVTAIYGGGVRLFQFSGTQTQPQLVRMLGLNGGALPSTIRLSIVRVE